MPATSIDLGLDTEADDDPYAPADPTGAAQTRFHALARGEQLMLWSLRAVALGHGDCPALRRALQVSLGSSAEEAFTSLFAAVRTLGWCAKRRLRLHVPGCDGLSADERSLLDLFAAAQHALADGDERPVRRQLAALVEAPLTEGLLSMLQATAGALEVNGYPLPRRGSGPQASAPLDGRHLH